MDVARGAITSVGQRPGIAVVNSLDKHLFDRRGAKRRKVNGERARVRSVPCSIRCTKLAEDQLA